MRSAMMPERISDKKIFIKLKSTVINMIMPGLASRGPEFCISAIFLKKCSNTEVTDQKTNSSLFYIGAIVCNRYTKTETV